MPRSKALFLSSVPTQQTRCSRRARRLIAPTHETRSEAERQPEQKSPSVVLKQPAPLAQAHDSGVAAQ